MTWYGRGTDDRDLAECPRCRRYVVDSEIDPITKTCCLHPGGFVAEANQTMCPVCRVEPLLDPDHTLCEMCRGSHRRPGDEWD